MTKTITLDEQNALIEHELSQRTRSQAIEKAMRLLAMREHSRLELQRKLSQRDFSESIIQAVLTELAEQNMQSDPRFAASFVRLKSERGYGPLAIRRDLKEKGIDDVLIQAHLPIDDDFWFAKALAAKEKKFGLSEAIDLKQKAKQYRFLQYRGFSHTHIRYAMASHDFLS